jgi:CrcB protein
MERVGVVQGIAENGLGGSLDRYLMVLFGGAAGSLARYLVANAVQARIAGKFPYGTFFINITGSFLVGVIMTILSERLDVHPNWRLLLVVGFLGGYTTFSAYEWETYYLARFGHRGLAMLNGLGSVILGYLAVWLGATIAAKR